MMRDLTKPLASIFGHTVFDDVARDPDTGRAVFAAVCTCTEVVSTSDKPGEKRRAARNHVDHVKARRRIGQPALPGL